MKKRIIKFRFWESIPNTPIRLISNNIDTLSKNPSVLISMIFENTDGLITCDQWTGLHDKDGKEIYDGDIVSDFSDGCNKLVKWSDQNASFYLSSTTNGKSYYKEFIQCGQSQSDGPVCIDSIKVLGNIYTNLELISALNDERSVATDDDSSK